MFPGMFFWYQWQDLVPLRSCLESTQAPQQLQAPELQSHPRWVLHRSWPPKKLIEHVWNRSRELQRFCTVYHVRIYLHISIQYVNLTRGSNLRFRAKLIESVQLGGDSVLKPNGQGWAFGKSWCWRGRAHEHGAWRPGSVSCNQLKSVGYKRVQIWMSEC